MIKYMEEAEKDAALRVADLMAAPQELLRKALEKIKLLL